MLNLLRSLTARENSPQREVDVQSDSSPQSLAIWYRARQQSEAASAQLHFNLWNYPGRSFLDIGIMIREPDTVGDLFIYIPVELDKCSVEDLSPKLKNRHTAIGIFNEPVSTQDKSGHVDIFLEPHGNELLLRAHCLSDGEYTLDNQINSIRLSGAVFTIKQSAIERGSRQLKTQKPLYFRIRIDFKGVSNNPFLLHFRPLDSHLLTGYDVSGGIDFRLNESRNLPEAVSRLMTDPGYQQFNILEIHFLVAIDIRVDFIGAYQPFHKCRILENATWSEYISNEASPKTQLPRMVTYHWKKTATVERNGEHVTSSKTIHDFSAFVKFKVRESNWFTLSKYLLFAFAVGAIGSYAANYIPVINLTTGAGVTDSGAKKDGNGDLNIESDGR